MSTAPVHVSYSVAVDRAYPGVSWRVAKRTVIKDACLMGMPSRVGPVANLGLRRAIVSDGLVMPAGVQQQLWDGGFSEGPGGWNWRCRTPGPKVLTKHKGRDVTKGKDKKDKKRTGSAKHRLLAIGSCRKRGAALAPALVQMEHGVAAMAEATAKFLSSGSMPNCQCCRVPKLAKLTEKAVNCLLRRFRASRRDRVASFCLFGVVHTSGVGREALCR